MQMLQCLKKIVYENMKKLPSKVANYRPKPAQNWEFNYKYRMGAIITRSWILTIHKGKIFWKKLLKNTLITFKKWVKNIQATDYSSVRTVCLKTHLSTDLWFEHTWLDVILEETNKHDGRSELGSSSSRFI